MSFGCTIHPVALSNELFKESTFRTLCAFRNHYIDDPVQCSDNHSLENGSNELLRFVQKIQEKYKNRVRVSLSICMSRLKKFQNSDLNRKIKMNTRKKFRK